MERKVREDPATGSTLELRNGFHILNLRGSPYHRGFAHGRLLKEEILESNISGYYGNFHLAFYRSSDLNKKTPSFLRNTIGEILQWWYYSPPEKLCLEETKEEVFAVADATGLDGKDTLEGNTGTGYYGAPGSRLLRGDKEALGIFR
ncbi:MAG: hypothetical protein DRP87_12295 [Spirochaetes bacterium]|nr:MAG: hypothetical protein DRP87_12295 [Spirochaetota bacterium]